MHRFRMLDRWNAIPIARARRVTLLTLAGLALGLLTLGAALPAASQAATRDQAWSEPRAPAAGPPRTIGAVNAGCLAGAARLPFDGPGYEAVRVSRNRHFGHPRLVDYIRELGAGAARQGLPLLYIGDMAQPRGGPMNFGHGSHQSGLDADIWFNLDAKPRLPAVEREEIETPSMVLADQSGIDRANWRPEHVRLLRLAATSPHVDRIFVHWTIKRELCDTVTGDRGWLRRIRPWRGHEQHFHVRLSCPPDSPQCASQVALGDGDGCDSSLDWWFTTPASRRRVAPSEDPAPSLARATRLPARCAAVLGQIR